MKPFLTILSLCWCVTAHGGFAFHAPNQTFDPRMVPGLKLYVEASALGLGNNAQISSATDLSGSGNTLTNSAAGTACPTNVLNVLNGRPVMRFDGVDDRLTTILLTNAQPFTTWIVGKVSASDTDAATFIDSFNNSQAIIYRGKTGDQPGNFVGASGAQLVAAQNTAFSLLTFIANGASSTLLTNSIVSQSGNAGTNTLSGVSIGNIRGNPSPIVAAYELNGDIATALIYNVALADADRQRVEQFFRRRYGLW